MHGQRVAVVMDGNTFSYTECAWSEEGDDDKGCERETCYHH